MNGKIEVIEVNNTNVNNKTRNARKLKQTLSELYPYGHLDLRSSDFGYWSCSICGKRGDDYTHPKDFECASKTKRTKLFYDTAVLETRKFFDKTGINKAIIGVSGGIDSALVAAITAEAIGGHNITGISMPSRFSSSGSLTDAEELMINLGGGYMVVEIEDLVEQFTNKLKLSGLAHENVQARVRGTVLMSVSNMKGGIVMTTGNRSEILMGYCTMYGDTVGGFAPISKLYKTEVYDLAEYGNSLNEVIPKNTIMKPPSAELRHNQFDTDSLPEYSELDPFLKAYDQFGGRVPEKLMECFNKEFSKTVLNRITSNSWKWDQLPTGPEFKISPEIKNDW
mgnify:CR=1 FL=1